MPTEREYGRSWALPCYLTGQGVSLLGDEAYYVALTWAAAAKGGAAGVALVASVAAVPRALLMLPGGAIADRFGLRRIMIGSDAVRTVVIALAGVLLLNGGGLWVLAGTALVFGVADALFMPSTAAMPARLVRPEDLQRTNGLITFLQRTMLLAGAPLGGLLAAGPGPWAAFLFEAGTFAVSLVCLAVLPLPPSPAAPPTAGAIRTAVRGFTEGPRIIWRSPVLRGLVIANTLSELGFTGPYNAGLPLLARYRGWGAGGMGLLLAAFGLGAALGALAAVAISRRLRPGYLIIAAGVFQAVALTALGFVPGLPAALALSFAIGVFASLFGTVVTTLVQLSAEPAALVRVMSVVNLSSYGSAPVANAVTGVTAALASVPGAFLLGGVIEVAAALAGLCLRSVRNVRFPSPPDAPPP
jgi:predicted MFS family arabinose efflux permease